PRSAEAGRGAIVNWLERSRAVAGWSSRGFGRVIPNDGPSSASPVWRAWTDPDGVRCSPGHRRARGRRSARKKTRTVRAVQFSRSATLAFAATALLTKTASRGRPPAPLLEGAPRMAGDFSWEEVEGEETSLRHGGRLTA